MHLLPNILSIIRIILIPFFIYYFIATDYLIAGVLFSISGITDFFDGYFARKYDLTSKLGRMLDPFADKLTIISILIALTIKSIIPGYIALIILTREVFIFLSSIISYLMGFDFINPSYIGKASIFLLYIAIALQLMDFNSIATYLFYLAIPLNVISGYNYIHTTAKCLSNKSNI